MLQCKRLSDTYSTLMDMSKQTGGNEGQMDALIRASGDVARVAVRFGGMNLMGGRLTTACDYCEQILYTMST